MDEAAIYVHYPCFDGVVSAAIASDFLENAKGWSITSIRPVNYDVASTWIGTPLPPRTAIVDFLYHPGAAFWADHHATTFVSEAAKLDYEKQRDRRTLLYDRTSLSCGMLVYRSLKTELSDAKRFHEMAVWADRIDGALYESVQEAIFGSSAATKINLSLADDTDTDKGDQEYCELLIRELRSKTLEQVASLPEVGTRTDTVEAKMQAGLDLVRRNIALEPGDIAVARIEPPDEIIVNRYSPYYWQPNARYSVVISHTPRGATIRAMRNPWRDFESVPLGEIFQRYGGGGHQRVGAVVIPPGAGVNPDEVLSRIVEDIRTQDAVSTGGRAKG